MSLKLNVKDGTPNHSGPSLCMSCTHSIVMQGDRTSDLKILCKAAFEMPIRIDTKIIKCNCYHAEKETSLFEMQKIGYVLETKKGKPIGFVSAAEHRLKVKGDNPDVDTHDDDPY